MKSILTHLLGFIFLFVFTACTGLGTPSAAPAPISSAQDKVNSTPTSRPPAPSRVASASLPPICDCVLRFDRISIEQGLSQSSVHVILQDSRGFMWFGTEDGLNRYDGYTFKTFKPDPDVPTSLSDRWINSIVEDRAGYLWIATRQGGLNRYDPRTEEFTRYTHDELNSTSLNDNHANVVYLDKDDRLWV